MKECYLKIFANQLKKYRLKNNLQQSELADLIGVQQSAIARYERGVIFPSDETIQMLSKALKCSCSDLFNNEIIVDIVKTDIGKRYFLYDLGQNTDIKKEFANALKHENDEEYYKDRIEKTKIKK